MSNDITQIVTFLAQPRLAVPEDLKNDLHKVVSTLLSPQINEDTKKILVGHLKQGRTTKDTYKAILIESMLLALEGKPASSIKLKALLAKYQPTLADGAATLSTLNWWRFSGKESADPRTRVHCDRETFYNVFDKTLEPLDALYKQVTGGSERPFARNGKVIVLTRQMIMPPHAPTVRTLEFAKNLIENHGKEVLIVCSSETTREPLGPLAPRAVGQFSPQFLDASTLNYEGHALKMVMTGRGIFSDDAVLNTLKIMDDFNPEMILSIGAPNILAEPFGDRAFCFFYMSGRDIPMTRNQHFHTWEALTPEQERTLKKEGTLGQHLFVSTPGYHRKEQHSTLAREQFGIPDDVFLFAVIGLRLASEVDEAFLKLMDKIAAETDSWFLLAGRLENYETVFDAFPRLKERAKFIGMQSDIMAVYELCNAYINPDRAGGGSSAAQALQGDVPVLTRHGGDVGFMVQNAPKYETYDDLAKDAVAIATDPAKYEEFAAKAKLDGDRLSVRNEYLSRIITEFEAFADRKSAK